MLAEAEAGATPEAATTAGRVPLNGPGVEYTLRPTVSCVVMRLSHALRAVAVPSRLVNPRSTIVCTCAVRG